jgi:hypothetical protein
MIIIDTWYIIFQYNTELESRSLNSEIKRVYAKSNVNPILTYYKKENAYNVMRFHKKIKPRYDRITSHIKDQHTINNLMKSIRPNADHDLIKYIQNISNFKCSKYESELHEVKEYKISYNSGASNFTSIYLSECDGNCAIYFAKISINNICIEHFVGAEFSMEYLSPIDNELISFVVMFLVMKVYTDNNYTKIQNGGKDILYEFLRAIHVKDIRNMFRCTDMDLSYFNL